MYVRTYRVFYTYSYESTVRTLCTWELTTSRVEQFDANAKVMDRLCTYLRIYGLLIEKVVNRCEIVLKTHLNL